VCVCVGERGSQHYIHSTTYTAYSREYALPYKPIYIPYNLFTFVEQFDAGKENGRVEAGIFGRVWALERPIKPD
jgi:hypothetical protein